MTDQIDDIVHQLASVGFRPTYQSLAVRLLVHPEHPGVEARIGTVYVVVERDGHEIYREPQRNFRLEDVMQSLHRFTGRSGTE